MSMSQAPVMKRRTPKWILAGWLLTFMLGTAWWLAPIANASHSDSGSYRLHQAYIHYQTGDGNQRGYWDEDWCWDSHTSRMTDVQFRDRIIDTFYNASPHWDGNNAGDWRLDLWYTAEPCTSYPDRDWIDLEFRLKDYWSKCNGKSCVYHYGAWYDDNYAHYHYAWEWARIDTDHIDSSVAEYRELINHESGHIFGLLDGKGTCPGSIMHNRWYGCAYSDWMPTQKDFNSVTNIMNGG